MALEKGSETFSLWGSEQDMVYMAPDNAGSGPGKSSGTSWTLEYPYLVPSMDKYSCFMVD